LIPKNVLQNKEHSEVPTVLNTINSTKQPYLDDHVEHQTSQQPLSKHAYENHLEPLFSKKSTTNESYLYKGNVYDNIQKQYCKFIMKIDIHWRNGNEHYIFLLLHLSVYSPSSSVPSCFFDAVLFLVVCRGNE
jgi:hypothetical protein